MKKSGWIWSTTKTNHEKLGQKNTNRAKNRTNRAKDAPTQNVQIFHVFFAVQILILFFLEIQTMFELNNIPITMSQNHF